ncbi:ABC transporter ATP-binding protein [Oceanobacillus sp. J11TS1]|uniref:ABC transporter ATP-binding protein n=1 Tax=Oceanobacillus sp. J11TS1 TaxID=2807191 RepID=UPI001BB43FCA|nr:dipeptide ABC transporter ATP-binding protein [Oceanobacillus sp. J11TS1]
MEKKAFLEVKHLKKYFPVRNSIGISQVTVKAVDDVTFTLNEGETFCLVGESGCGKSTVGRTILRLTEPTDGEVRFQGEDIFQYDKKELHTVRKDMQMVFQDPFSSLNPRKRIGSILEEPLKIHKIGTSKERTEKVMNLLERVGLQRDQYYRFPYEFSGGQRQRIGLARALSMNPELIICDEPVSALDVSTQSQILNLLLEIQQDLQLTYLFISHDLSVVRHIGDRIGVMYLGKIVESAPTDALFETPKHPYTKALLSAIPIPDPQIEREKIQLRGEIPSPLNPPAGCPFHTRCPFVMDVCKKSVPETREVGQGHLVSCHLYTEENDYAKVVDN